MSELNHCSAYGYFNVIISLKTLSITSFKLVHIHKPKLWRQSLLHYSNCFRRQLHKRPHPDRLFEHWLECKPDGDLEEAHRVNKMMWAIEVVAMETDSMLISNKLTWKRKENKILRTAANDLYRKI
jgi:hypothetical protein